MKSQYQRELEDNKEQIKELLGDEYQDIDIGAFQISEIPDERTSFSSDSLKTSTGYGPVDATWNALVQEYSDTYEILDEVDFLGYSVEVLEEGDIISMGSRVAVEITAINNICKMFIKKESNSVLRASVECVRGLAEYLINGEKAYRKLHILLEDAEKRNRQDLKKKYVNMLSDIVRFISYRNLNLVSDI